MNLSILVYSILFRLSMLYCTVDNLRSDLLDLVFAWNYKRRIHWLTQFRMFHLFAEPNYLNMLVCNNFSRPNLVSDSLDTYNIHHSSILFDCKDHKKEFHNRFHSLMLSNKLDNPDIFHLEASFTYEDN